MTSTSCGHYCGCGPNLEYLGLSSFALAQAGRQQFQMAGVLPFDVSMTNRILVVRYYFFVP